MGGELSYSEHRSRRRGRNCGEKSFRRECLRRKCKFVGGKVGLINIGFN